MQHNEITTWVQKRGDDEEGKERQLRKLRRREGSENEDKVV
jgi:hypothetical protein